MSTSTSQVQRWIVWRWFNKKAGVKVYVNNHMDIVLDPFYFSSKEIAEKTIQDSGISWYITKD